jgi:hypothetical protein
MKSASIILLLAIVICSASPGHAETPISVYIFAKTDDGGFVDSSRVQDSVRDLIEVISKHKEFVAIATPDATITLEVVASGHAIVGNEASTNIRRGIFGNIQSSTTVQNKTLPSLSVIMHVHGSDYSKEFTVTAQWFWKDLAKNIVNQVSQWTAINRQHLTATVAAAR